jgi:hypothetical protein
LIQTYLNGVAASPLRALCPRMIHQNAAHLLAGDRQKVPSAFYRKRTASRKMKISLIDERPGDQRVARRFTPKLPGGDATQFPVNQSNGSLARLAVALLHLSEQHGESRRLRTFRLFWTG